MSHRRRESHSESDGDEEMCPDCAFIQDNADLNPDEKAAAVEEYLCGKRLSQGNCSKHPNKCDCGEDIVYTSFHLISALGKNGGTKLPKKCQSCRSAGKATKFNPKETKSMHQLGKELLRKIRIKDDHEDAMKGNKDSGENVKKANGSEFQEQYSDDDNKLKMKTFKEKKTKTTEQTTKDFEKKERRVKGGLEITPPARQNLLPIYCNGGSLCGASVEYTLDKASLKCASKSHACAWKTLRCVHCGHTWDDFRTHHLDDLQGSKLFVKLEDHIHQMFTHHVCLECGAGLHGGVSNHYGVLLH